MHRGPTPFLNAVRLGRIVATKSLDILVRTLYVLGIYTLSLSLSRLGYLYLIGFIR